MPSSSSQNSNNQQTKRCDASTETADLESMADQMNVYIPLHISGDGVNRAMTRTDSRRKSSASNNNMGTNSRRPSTINNSRRESTATSTNEDQQQDESSGNNNNNNLVKTRSRTNSLAMNASVTSVSSTSRRSSRNPMDDIPGNFPVPATCSLNEIRAKLENLLRSKVFLGFIDVRTGGLVELRNDTMEVFNLIPDQRKAIHCRKLKKEKTRSELMLEASSKHKEVDDNDLDYHHQQHNEGGSNNNNAADEDPNVEEVDVSVANNSAAHQNRARKKSVMIQDQESPSRNEIDRRAAKREKKHREQELVDRLLHADVQARERRRRKLESEMYPSYDSNNNNSANNNNNESKSRGFLYSSTSNGAHNHHASPVKVKTQKEIDEAMARIADAETVKQKREQKNEQTRQKMISEGYIVEPDQFRKVSHENDTERNERYFGRGVAWLRKHSEKVASMQEKEKERKVVKIKKEDWDQWLEKRSKPLERDKYAAQNQVVYVPYGSSASAVLKAQEREKEAKATMNSKQ